MGVSTDSRFGEFVTRVLVVMLPLLFLGGIAEAIDGVRQRMGPVAFVLPVLIAFTAGVAVWSIAAREDAALLDARVLGVSVAILCLLWMATCWAVLAGTLRLLRRKPLQTDVA